MPDWVQDAVWWHVYPLGFVGAEKEATEEVTSRLHRIGDWLDYAVELGANGLALGPVFASSTRGYDTVDHLRIDPRLGDDADFDALVAAAHDRGLWVLLDGVFNQSAVGASGPCSSTARKAGWSRPTWLKTPSSSTRRPRSCAAATRASKSASSPSRGSIRAWSTVS